MEKGQDITLGLVCAGIGIAGAWMASSYSGAGGTYPMVLGIVLALLGALVSARALLRAEDEERPLINAPANLLIALAAGAAYIGLILPLGFYTASALLMLVLPVALGFRRPVFTLSAAATFVAMVWLIFSVILEKPLPREIWVTFTSGGA